MESGILGPSMGGGDSILNGDVGAKFPQYTKDAFVGIEAMYFYFFMLFVTVGCLYLLAIIGPLIKKKKVR